MPYCSPEVISSICPKCLWLFTHIFMFFTSLFFFSSMKFKSFPIKISSIQCSLASFLLFYDSLIVSLGTMLPQSSNLRILSIFRYISRLALILIFFLITVLIIPFPKNLLLYLNITIIILLGIGIFQWFDFGMKFKTIGGVNIYTTNSDIFYCGPSFPLLIGGIYDIKENKSGYIFLGGFLLFAFSTVPLIKIEVIFFYNILGEILMLIFLFLGIYHKEKFE